MIGSQAILYTGRLRIEDIGDPPTAREHSNRITAGGIAVHTFKYEGSEASGVTGIREDASQ